MGEVAWEKEAAFEVESILDYVESVSIIFLEVYSIIEISNFVLIACFSPCPPHHLLLFCSCEPTIWRNFLRIIDIYKN